MEGCGQIDVILRRVLALPHRAVIEPEQLEAHGLPADVSLALLSRKLVCEACGAHTSRVFRSIAADAERFLRT